MSSSIQFLRIFRVEAFQLNPINSSNQREILSRRRGMTDCLALKKEHSALCQAFWAMAESGDREGTGQCNLDGARRRRISSGPWMFSWKCLSIPQEPVAMSGSERFCQKPYGEGSHPFH
jgi:hypothetical protein